ncbi:hypothetical protein FNW02_17160 [Komarekiella sp. 'clone 1']|uniref:Uncharacterized protein n=1 Tax=Komarekiella delphini-convector SJRDD-AB1 TaxID=2593771 RepID=A0AA40VS18_9NOST|nr:hypothetical protein [Komarekiella delphini-convector]MBD6617507.1 hypothetical protein [Komarekiella delphini-convector SJRDD-AB1]
MDDFKIAFLSKHLFDSDAIQGAVLVTDKNTKPLEFRVTEPIRPTKFQRTLYGEILYDYIFVELIAIPLLAALKEKPSIVLIQDEIFLSINSKQEIPVFRLLKENEAMFSKQIRTEQITSSPGSKSLTLRITTTSKFESQLNTTKLNLEEVHASRDLLEPFNRLRIACEQINTQSPEEQVK